MNECPVVLTINCVSSSIKFAVLDAKNCDVLLSGICEGIHTERAVIRVHDGASVILTHLHYEEALDTIFAELDIRKLIPRIAYVGHRVAHGGALFSQSVLINEEVLAHIRQISPLAPLHNEANLHGIAFAKRCFPDVPHVAVFDTSFHQTLKPEAYLYGLPYHYYEHYGVRRYGFHGTSHRYVAKQAMELFTLDPADSGLVIAHLGNGASVCAVKNGESVDTSMGMTPLEGLIMGTRCGDVDFGAMAWIARQTGQSMEELEHMVNQKSGLLGLSTMSSDIRTLESAWHRGEAQAQLAIRTFVHRIVRTVGAHAVSLTRFDGLIFTGGIGENSRLIRRLVVERLRVFGLLLDESLNKHPNSMGERRISDSHSVVACAVIPTNEEKMIALDALNIGRALEP